MAETESSGDRVATGLCRYGTLKYFSGDLTIGRSLARYGEWAQAELDLLLPMLNPGSTVADVGAFIGTHTLAFAQRVGAEGRVYAFEPNPDSFQLLKENVGASGLGNVCLIQAALSDAPGRLSLREAQTSPENPGMFGLKAAGAGGASSTGEIDVQVDTLDAQGLAHCDLIKIDVEGMEARVLAGGARLLERARPLVFAEILDLDAAWSLVTAMAGRAYLPFLHIAPAFNPANFKAEQDDIFGTAREANLLFVAQERLPEYAAQLTEGPTFVRIYTLDDLALGLLRKPQYKVEALQRTSAAALLGVDFWANEPELRTLQDKAGRVDRLEADHAALTRSLETSRAEAASRQSAHEQAASIRAQAADRVAFIRAQIQDRPTHHSAPPPAGRTYDILIPVFNAYEHLARCIESVLACTEPRHRLWLLDDASPDGRVLPLLRRYQDGFEHVQVVPSQANAGFVANINRGFALAQNHVVILNSDTEVTPGWLDRMDRCASSAAGIGIVCPLSNNATLLSVPVMNSDNELPAGVTPGQMAAIVAASAGPGYPRIPTAVGFCMLITRQALDRLGGFDPAFGLGYGEENDFSLRAWQAGFEVVCCDDAYVHHFGSASFRDVRQIDERRAANRRLLDRRWPAYHPAVSTFCHINPLRQIQEAVRTALGAPHVSDRPHILHVIHNFNAPGGTELHTRSLAEGLAAEMRSTVLYPGRETGAWSDMAEEEASADLRVLRLRRENASVKEFFTDFPGELMNSLIEGNFARLVAGGDYDLVHFQHLGGWATLLLPLIARALGKRVVISLHDYFLVCPEFNLVTPDIVRCGQDFADASRAECIACLGAKRRRVAGGPPVDLRRYLEERHVLARLALEAADVIVAPSSFVRDRFGRVFGDAIARRVSVIPHGVELPAPLGRPRGQAKLRVGFLGNLTERKGGRILFQAAARLAGKPIRFEVFGGVAPELRQPAAEHGIIVRGPYQRADLQRLTREIDLLVTPSVWDETFCLTVAEAQALGIPVLATRAGAIPERIEDGRTGFLVPPGDAPALSARLVQILDDRRQLERVAECLRSEPVKSLAENVDEYRRLYFDLIRPPALDGEMIRSLLGLPAGQAAGGGREEAESLLKELLESDDILQTLEARQDDLDEALFELVRSNSRTARANGDGELARGLDNLAAYIAGVLAERALPVGQVESAAPLSSR